MPNPWRCQGQDWWGSRQPDLVGGALPMAGSWNWVGSEDPSNASHSIILWEANLRGPAVNFFSYYCSLLQMSAHIFIMGLLIVFFAWWRDKSLVPTIKKKNTTILDHNAIRKRWKTGAQVHCKHPKKNRSQFIWLALWTAKLKMLSSLSYNLQLKFFPQLWHLQSFSLLLPLVHTLSGV